MVLRDHVAIERNVTSAVFVRLTPPGVTSAPVNNKPAVSLQLSRHIRHSQSGTSQPKEQIISEKLCYCAVSQYICRLLCNQSVRHSSANEAN